MRHKALLAATQADWTRREIKCRLCPDTRLKTWEDFKRHCDTMEAHPLKISFCGKCGDFFARGDSLERHYRNRPKKCFSLAPEEAGAKLDNAPCSFFPSPNPPSSLSSTTNEGLMSRIR